MVLWKSFYTNEKFHVQKHYIIGSLSFLHVHNISCTIHTFDLSISESLVKFKFIGKKYLQSWHCFESPSDLADRITQRTLFPSNEEITRIKRKRERVVAETIKIISHSGDRE